MSRQLWFRRAHRWLSIIFTVAVIANFAVIGRDTVALWVGSLTLLPLALLLFSGLYLLALPYAAKWRAARATVSTAD